MYKNYQIHQSPFYKLKSKKRLAKLFNISIIKLLELTNEKYYRIFLNNKRQIEEPIGLLKLIHKKIQIYLSRINYPNYLFSGIKNRSAIINAHYHQKSNYILTVDIKSFYKSCNIEYIFRFFYYKLKMSVDVARILSKIVTYQNFVPTGSPSSQLISFFAYSFIFDQIDNLANNNNINFSLYVDDITLSSATPINKAFHLKISKILNRVGLSLKKSKIKYYSKKQSKLITGCIITPNNELKVKNKQKQKIINKLKEININKNYKLKSSLLGLINYSQQIEPNLFNNLKREIKNITVS